MKIQFSLFFALLFSFSIFPIFSIEFYSISPFYDVKWTFETTRGWQSFGVISKEGGGSSQTQKVMEVEGLLFHSFFRERLFAKAQLNLAFSKSPMFLWTDRPDFSHESASLNQNLECEEFDFQFYFPHLGFGFIHFLPFVGYSFVNYTGDNDSDDTFSYSNVSGGIQYFEKINRYYSHTFYVSYSPMFLIEGFSLDDILHYMNYGAEFLTTFRYFSLTLFVNFRRAFFDLRKFGFFDETKYRFNTSEVGFSFHITL